MSSKYLTILLLLILVASKANTFSFGEEPKARLLTEEVVATHEEDCADEGAVEEPAVTEDPVIVEETTEEPAVVEETTTEEPVVVEEGEIIVEDNQDAVAIEQPSSEETTAESENIDNSPAIFQIPARKMEEGDEKLGFKIYDDESLPLCYCPNNEEGYTLNYSGVRVHNNRVLNPIFQEAICVPDEQTKAIHYLSGISDEDKCFESLYCVLKSGAESDRTHLPNAAQNNVDVDPCQEGYGCGYVEPKCSCPENTLAVFHNGNHDSYDTVNESHTTYVYKAMYCRNVEFSEVDLVTGIPKLCKRGYSCLPEEDGLQIQGGSKGICKEGYVCAKLEDIPEEEEEEEIVEENEEEDKCGCKDEECALKNKQPSILNLRLKRFGKLKLNIDTKEKIIINIVDDCCGDVCKKNIDDEDKCGCSSEDIDMNNDEN